MSCPYRDPNARAASLPRASDRAMALARDQRLQKRIAVARKTPRPPPGVDEGAGSASCTEPGHRRREDHSLSDGPPGARSPVADRGALGLRVVPGRERLRAGAGCRRKVTGVSSTGEGRAPKGDEKFQGLREWT